MWLSTENRHIVKPSVTAIAASLILFASAAMAESGDIGIKLLHGQGKIQYQKPGSDGWLKVDSLTEIAWGDKVRTREYSSADIKLGDAGGINLAPATIISLKPGIDSISGEKAVIEIDRGEARIVSGPKGNGIAWRVHMKEGFVNIGSHFSDLSSAFRIIVGSDSTLELVSTNGWVEIAFTGISPQADSLNKLAVAGYFERPEQVGREWSERCPIIQTGEKVIISSSGTIVHIGRVKSTD